MSPTTGTTGTTGTADTSNTDTLTTYVVWDESGEKVTIYAASAAEAAEEYVESGNWDDSSNQSVFHDVWVHDGEDTSSHTVVVAPEEPECSGHEHDWVETYVRGNGGGVLVEERCRNCGLRKVTDTWAHNPSNGEQGFTTIQYLEEENE